MASMGSADEASTETSIHADEAMGNFLFRNLYRSGSGARSSGASSSGARSSKGSPAEYPRFGNRSTSSARPTASVDPDHVRDARSVHEHQAVLRASHDAGMVRRNA